MVVGNKTTFVCRDLKKKTLLPSRSTSEWQGKYF